MRRRPTASLTIECLGLPGVGKSRLCSAAAAALGESGIETRLHLRRRRGPWRRLITAARVLWLLARRPAWCRRTLLRLRSAQPSRAGWLARTWLKRSAAAEHQARQPAVHLNDSGIAQAIWSLAVRARADDAEAVLRALAEEATLPNLLLLLDCRPGLLAERLAGREPPAADSARALVARDAAELARGRALIERLAAILAAPAEGRPTPRLVRLDNNDETDLARNVERIVSLIEAAAA